MDLSAACNLACRDCYTKHVHTSRLLSTDHFALVLEKLTAAGVTIEKLHLNWRGEPLTNKRFGEFLRIRNTTAPGVPLEFHTNGLLLSHDTCAEIVQQTREGDLAYVSIDGGGQVLHEANRGPGTWLQTLRGLARLLDARDAAGGPHLSVGIYEITYLRGAIYDRELVALSRRCDAWTRVCPIDREGREIPFADDVVPQGACFWAGNAMCITVTGDVHVCMLSFDRSGVIGNIFSEEVDDILRRGQAFRSSLVSSGRRAVPHCRNCYKTEGTIDD